MINPESNEFLNKNVLVTGASSGIGQSVAFYFLNCGAQVILVGTDVESMKRMVTKNNFTNATIMSCDLLMDIHVFDLKTSVIERLKNKIDIMVNCAGIKLDGDVQKTFPQEFDFTMDLNLRSTYALIKHFYKFINRGGSIINMSCLYGNRPMYGMISYAMSKAGLETLTRYAAAELAGAGIRVNAISPCPVKTNSLRYVNVSDAEIAQFEQKMQKNIPMGRMALPDDIVKVVTFLASKRSSKITGQIIRVDGGRGLTSSGYVHYKGMRNMNSRFEPDGVNLSEWFGSISKKFTGEKEVVPIQDAMKLKQFVEEKIRQSNFSTRDSDAHTTIFANYKNIEGNDEKLAQKFLLKEMNKTPGGFEQY